MPVVRKIDEKKYGHWTWKCFMLSYPLQQVMTIKAVKIHLTHQWKCYQPIKIVIDPIFNPVMRIQKTLNVTSIIHWSGCVNRKEDKNFPIIWPISLQDDASSCYGLPIAILLVPCKSKRCPNLLSPCPFRPVLDWFHAFATTLPLVANCNLQSALWG